MERQLDEALKVLGIPVDSDRETVTSAYRRLARATHPDVSPDPHAAERFAIVAAAYRLVSGRHQPGAAPADAFRGPPCIDGLVSALARVGTQPLRACGLRGRLGDSGPDPGGARLLRGVSPFGPARSWSRPPIVAGPVMVRRAQPEAGKQRRDG